MRVGMCDCDCVPVFVSGWVLGCSLSWISKGCLSNVGPISSPPHSLSVAGVSARWCTCGYRCPDLGALVRAGSLPVAACPGLCQASAWGVMCLGSLGPWLKLLWRRRLLAGPVGL
ncbi:hypothetical protein ILYODFUR_036291 [Ilyodon furcidens]|uniref:Uncharacterized protein n=1 Tax=Ilyodon furcidens TaxID=33524 RepID=A0ABV0UZ55_9TELE